MSTEMFDGIIEKPDLDILFDDSCFAHYGRKGMKWGQNIFGKVVSSLGRARTGLKSVAQRANYNHQLKKYNSLLNSPSKQRRLVNRRVGTQALVGRMMTAKRPNLLNKTVKGDITRGMGTHALYGDLGRGSSSKTRRMLNELGSSFIGTYGNKSVRRIASYNSMSAKAKRGFNSFKSSVLPKHKKTTLSQLSSGKASVNSLLTTASRPVMSSKKKGLFNMSKSISSLKNVDDYTKKLLRRNASMLAGW